MQTPGGFERCRKCLDDSLPEFQQLFVCLMCIKSISDFYPKLDPRAGDASFRLLKTSAGNSFSKRKIEHIEKVHHCGKLKLRASADRGKRDRRVEDWVS